jgi:hypothetical protein
VRWFDREGFCGSFDDEQAEAVRAAYWRHIDRLRPHLPESVQRLALDVNLHDAKIESWDTEDGELRAGFGWGDLKVGYWLSTLTYRGAAVRVEPPDSLRNPETEVLYDEIDTAEEGFEHRLLLTPEGEISIRFRSMAIETKPLEQRGGYTRGGFPLDAL